MGITIGTRLGSYEILSLLGKGGMGEVYRARDADLGREVAVKILSETHSSDSEVLKRFEKEARLASSLNHPNIVTVHAVGRDHDITYIAMELVDGVTLDEILRKGPLPLPALLDVAVQIADGLAKAHNAGIVHRDLKPLNVMITKDNLVKILDFGLSKIVAPHLVDPQGPTLRDAKDTKPGVILGTVAYMAPEQVRGTNVDFRSDQFSFGSVLYEMASGKTPFARETSLQTLAAIIESEPVPIATINPAVPPLLQEVVRRCMEKKPEDRYPSTQDVARSLRMLRDTISAEILFPGTSPKAKRGGQWVVILAAMILAAIVLSIVIPEIRGRFSSGPDVISLPASKQLAILPFVNIGSDPTNQSLSDGLVETLTSKLTQLEPYEKSLRIVPSTEVRRESVTSARDALRLFGVTLVITGSVQRLADRVRVTINLVDARTLRQIAAKSIDAEMRDLSTMQDGIVLQAAELLGEHLSEQQRQLLVAGGTTVPGAFEFYLEGQGYLRRYDNADNVDSAIRLLNQAVDRDPQYALAYAALGEAYWRKYDLTKDRRLIEQARNSCAAARRLNDRLTSLYVTFGIIGNGTGQYEDAIRNLQRALELDPVSADAYRELAAAYAAQGKSQDAEATYKKAIEARPSYWAGYNELGAYYFRLGKYAEAEEQFRYLLDLTPDSYRAYSNLGGVYYATNRYADAASMFEKSVAIKPTGTAYSNLGTVYFYLGRYADAVPKFEQALKINDRDYRLWKNLAAAYYWTPDQRNKARQPYERAIGMAEEERRVNPKNPRVLIDLADCYSMIGQNQRAKNLLDEALHSSPMNTQLMFDAGVIHEQLGDRKVALEWIGKALSQGYSRDLIKRTPNLAQLRADPQFGKLLNP